MLKNASRKQGSFKARVFAAVALASIAFTLLYSQAHKSSKTSAKTQHPRSTLHWLQTTLSCHRCTAANRQQTFTQTALTVAGTGKAS